MSLGLTCLLLFIFLVGSAFFSGLETGVVAVNKLRLQHLVRRGVQPALILKDFLNRPDVFLGTTLVGTNLCNTAFSVLAASFAVSLTGPRAGPALAFVFTTFVVLLFGEYLPKAWFQSRPARRSMRFARVLRLFSFLFAPLTRSLEQLTNLLLPQTDEENDAYLLSREELYHLMIKGSEEAEYLTEQKKQMIHEVYQLANRSCRDLMVPRNDMIIIKHNTPVPEVLELARNQAFARFPIFSDEAQRFIGILNIFDLLEEPPDTARPLTDFIRPPQYVPEELSAEELIPRIRLTRQPMLLVRNQEAEVTGFITTEVVLAEIVGHFV